MLANRKHKDILTKTEKFPAAIYQFKNITENETIFIHDNASYSQA